MQAVLISIKPKYCDLIANGIKTVEVRKTKPKLETPFKVFIYCSAEDYNKIFCIGKFMHKVFLYGNGKQKIIGEFICDQIINIPFVFPFYSDDVLHPMFNSFTSLTCLEEYEIDNYLGKKDGYGWHISDLVIYDKPRELYDFVNYDKHEACLKKGCFNDDCWICPNNAIIVRPPQSWCYVKAIPDIPD